MKFLNRLTFSSLSLMIIVSCGGGGGGGGGSPDNSSSGGGGGSAPTYNYTKVTSQVSNYTWDSIATGIVTTELPAGSYVYNNSTKYYEDFIEDIGFSGYDNYTLNSTFTEVVDSSSFDFIYSGDTSSSDLSIAWNFNINDYNIDLIDLYEYGDVNPSYGLTYAYFTDAEMLLFGAYDEYLASLGLEYVNGFQLAILDITNNDEYIIPTVFGDLTEVGDMPSSSDTISFEALSYYLEQDYELADTLQLAIQADGTLSINHSNNTLTGTMTLRRYAELSEFLIGNGATNQYSSLPQVVVNIVNGQIIGNKFTADLQVDDTSNSGLYIGGKISGGFFGPDANEVGASFFIYDDQDGDDSNYYFGGGFLLGD